MKKIMMTFGLLFTFAVVFSISALAVETTVTTTNENGEFPGKVLVPLDTNFPNASIVTVEGNGVSTKAVVAEGNIEFYVSSHGTYTIASTGETVRDHFYENLQTETMYEYAYKGSGTATDPYVVLSTFADIPMEKFKLQAAWKGYNVLAGYTGLELYSDADYLRSYNKSKVYVLRCEDRDPVTGCLNGAFVLDGHLWTHVNGEDKGPYYMNYLIDPTDMFITSGYALDNHYLYNSDNVDNVEQRKADAVQTIKGVRDSKTSALFFNYRMRDFSGPITFTVDLEESGKFMPGDKVSVHYLLGSGDRNLYHQIKPDPAELIKLEPTYRKFYQDKGVVKTVDMNGCLTITLYNGGYFALKNESSLQDGRIVTVKQKAYDMVTLHDVKKDDWSYDSIYAQLEKSYMSEVGGNFKPDLTIHRADFIKTLLLSAGVTLESGKGLPFDDVPKGSPYHDYVYTAYKNGITSGMSETIFGAEQGLTREMAAVLICRTLSILPADDDFVDSDTISDWAKGYAGACRDAGYLSGYPNGGFGPRNLLIRAEAAVLMERVYQDLNKDI